MKKYFNLKLLFLLPFITVNLYGQEMVFGKKIDTSSKDPENNIIRCITTEYEEYLQNKYKERATEQEFEQWLAPKVSRIKTALKSGKTSKTIIIIPLVVHVIHNGTAIGTAANLSDERIQSQITVLNQDFRRMFGTPGYNNNPIGADIEIEFRLAKIDPKGMPINGIDRIVKTGYIWNEANIENVLKPQTQWDPAKYFNIWVCEFGGDLNGTLGYAQFPSNSNLGGLTKDTGNTKTDGVVIYWKSFGSSDFISGIYLSTYDKGRTLTHEIGHALGLKHVWGDNKYCDIDATDSSMDYCLDTPATKENNFSCDKIIDSCPLAPGNDMTENYMDYTPDACMNTFTQDQKTRILTVLQNSPRRASLTTSDVWKDIDSIESLSSGISYYPNPATTELRILFKNTDEFPIKYTIYDNIGLFIEKDEVVNSGKGFIINTSNFLSGIYILVLSTNEGTRKIKFIVKR